MAKDFGKGENCGDLAAVADEGRDSVAIAKDGGQVPGAITTTVKKQRPEDKDLNVILPNGLADPLGMELLEL